ncbi:tetratricopeptide repeat protein, partial [Mariniblastus sp.]|nr:tetratricopeptide repeat protein [Mariniblastus sp.]
EITDTLFIQAQHEYLSGDWQAAESLLRQRLGRFPRDVESRLLLATLLRHDRRLEQASDQLDTMTKLDESHAWDFEIRRERRLIQLILEHEAVESAGIATETELLPDNNDGYVHIDVTGD